MASIELKTEVPGPKSRAMLARRASAVPTGLGKATDVVVERAEGALVHDVDGNTFIDFVGGIGVLAVGHCPPTGRRGRCTSSARQLVHMCSLVGTYESYVRAVRAAERDHARHLPQEDAARQQRRRSGRERRQGGARVHQAAGRHLLRGRRITAARCSRSA